MILVSETLFHVSWVPGSFLKLYFEGEVRAAFLLMSNETGGIFYEATTTLLCGRLSARLSLEFPPPLILVGHQGRDTTRLPNSVDFSINWPIDEVKFCLSIQQIASMLPDSVIYLAFSTSLSDLLAAMDPNGCSQTSSLS